MRLIAFFLFSFPPLCIFSQNNSFGFFVGPNHSTLLISTSANNSKLSHIYDIKIGYLIGGNFTHQFNRNIGFRTELVYQTKGGCLNTHFATASGGSYGIASVTYGAFRGPAQSGCDKFHYLELPLIFQLSFFEKTKLHLHFGQSIGYLIKWDAQYFSGEKSIELNRIEHSWLAGFGFSIPIKEKLYFQTNAKISASIKDISKSNLLELKNRTISAMFGIEYQLN